MTVRSTKKGPLFDGRAKEAVRAFQDDAEREVGQVLVNEIQADLGKVLKHPSGYYKRQITTDRVKDDLVVTDGGVIYGPWLEGTSSRNKTTRFKGYATFRRISQRVADRAGDIAERVLPKHLDGMK